MESVLASSARRPTPSGPLARKPKALAADPALFELDRGASGEVRAGRVRGGPARRGLRGGQPTTTDDGASLALGDDDTSAGVDPGARAVARQIAMRLSVRRPRRRRGDNRRGVGTLASLPFRAGSDDIDLDRTLEVLAERPAPDDEDIVVRERVRARRAVVLAVDVSGSMRGERVRTAAGTVGALAGELRDDTLAVVAFWSDAMIVLPFGGPVRPLRLLDDLLRIPTRGLTNIDFPLQIAAQMLADASTRDKRVVLLTDAVHNAGPDPRPAARRLPRLDVLVDVSGESDQSLGRELAAMGRGTFGTVRTYRDVAPALDRCFRP